MSNKKRNDVKVIFHLELDSNDWNINLYDRQTTKELLIDDIEARLLQIGKRFENIWGYLKFEKPTKENTQELENNNIELCIIGDKVTIMGNLNYNKLGNASPKQMYEDCAKHIKIAGKGGGYWLAFGCEIPRDMLPENIRAMVRAAKSTGKYPIK